ncbi:MAG TPA: glycosyltransferase family 4 protein [Candidatus Limnocylindrales bacterium]|nr:glycosyltransferase family 4 protein [Candidatus Limnocylindrales bacterium]
MSSVLLISSNPVNQRMTGPGIRYWEMATYLAEKHAVVLLVPGETDLISAKFQIFKTTRKNLKRWLGWADVIVTTGYKFPLDLIFLSQKPLVVDLYAPLPIELLEHHRSSSLSEARLSLAYYLARVQLLLNRGDFFICSHERQRDFWIGMLAAWGRITHELYREDPELKKLIQPVPFGLPAEKPVHTQQVLKGVRKGISASDKVILWGGGLWSWFDPCIVIRAVHEIHRIRSDIKLVFLGKIEDPVPQSHKEILKLSQELGLYDRYVFFTEQWIPYQERQNYLLEADIGISTHFASFESRLAGRTRILDYLWCGLPVIATRGDFWGDLIEKEGLGITVDPESVDQMKAAILELADHPEKVEQCRANVRRIADKFSWPSVLQPLEIFCLNPKQTHSSAFFPKTGRLISFYLRVLYNVLRYNGYKKVGSAIFSRCPELII